MQYGQGTVWFGYKINQEVSQKCLLNFPRRIVLCPYTRNYYGQILSPVRMILSFLGSILAEDKTNHLAVIQLQAPIDYHAGRPSPSYEEYMGIIQYYSYQLILFWSIPLVKISQRISNVSYNFTQKMSTRLGICMCLKDALSELPQLKMGGHQSMGTWASICSRIVNRPVVSETCFFPVLSASTLQHYDHIIKSLPSFQVDSHFFPPG